VAQHDYVIANGTGAAVRSDLNNALAAIVSQNSGATEPATMYAYQWWADTTTGLLKLRNAANNAWITLFQLDGEWSTLAVENGSAAAPSIYFKDSGTDTGFYSPGADQVAVATNGTQRLTVDSGGITSANGGVFKGDITTYSVDGIALSFVSNVSQIRACRSGGNYGSLAFFTPGANSSGAQAQRAVITSEGLVGIGTTAPTNKLVVSDGGNGGFEVAPGASDIQTYSYNRGTSAYITHTDLASAFIWSNGTNERFRCDTSGRLLVGTSTSVGGETVQFHNTTGNNLAVGRFVNSSGSPDIAFYKSRSGTIGTNAVVSNGDNLGVLSWRGADGTNYLESATISTWVDGTPGANDMPGRLVFSVTADGASSPTERMRIKSSGENWVLPALYGQVVSSATGAGTTYTLYEGLHSGGSVGAGTLAFRVFSNGNVQNVNASYGGTSDVKLKENIVDAPSQWNDLKALQVRKYNFKEGQTHTQIGLIAQEVEPISPGLVFETPDRDEEGNDLGTVTKGVNYSVLYMKAVKALQEAMERIEQLETEMAAVKAQLS
jgi:hypothetical protein